LKIGPRCVEVAEHLENGVEHALPSRLEAHCAHCVHCAALVEDAIELADALEAGGARYRHPKDFVARLEDALGTAAAVRLGLPKEPVFLSP